MGGITKRLERRLVFIKDFGARAFNEKSSISNVDAEYGTELEEKKEILIGNRNKEYKAEQNVFETNKYLIGKDLIPPTKFSEITACLVLMKNDLRKFSSPRRHLYALREKTCVTSKWSSPICAVLKAKGSVQICSDY
ncbi:Hypothetical protein SRAE_0000529500 [Strongyloides ratti]|uniref:Uncharacterized protein n=1 Tax=Strongyloides ratti TaxID=34506 RepID=A0A090L0K4_STRRB|nr:Hypothetical protein SRAE_0000529500 [Strongyloides ratti]CEF61657.1 Hypothetical protein SRAE_0000529500 [Strongyloides ratti]